MLKLTTFWMLHLPLLLLASTYWRKRSGKVKRANFRRASASAAICRPVRSNARKPDWVVDQLVQLKAMRPSASHRTLAAIFNRMFASRGMTVSSSYARYTVRNHAHRIELMRREIKNKPPAEAPKNAVWALDMTGKTDTTGRLHMILGILRRPCTSVWALRSIKGALRQPALCAGCP